MIEDLLDHSTGTTFETDVAIVGAGAAGITLARSLSAAKINVCLLESGGRDYEQPVQDLAKGENVGFPYYPLAESRLRFFGGTTAIWGGRSAELDPIDFERRPWVDHSGWPIDKSALESSYQQASALLDLPTDGIDQSDHRPANGHGLALDRSLIETSYWQFDEQFERFGLGQCADLVESPIVRILLHATVTRIAVNASTTAVEALEIANLMGRKATVRAKAFVLAAGGIETPRLLLASSDRIEGGVGNGHDLVGRFFIEHPRARGAKVVADKAWPLLRAMPRLHRSAGRLQAAVLRGATSLQEREGILNTAFSLAVRRPPDGRRNLSQRLYADIKHRLPPDRFGRLLWRNYRRAQIVARERINLARGWWRLKGGRYGLYVVIRGEQAPNPASRLVLDKECDALGMPRLTLDWRFSEIDKHSVRVLMSTLDRELIRLGLGRLELSDWLAEEGTPWHTDDLVGNHPVGGYHHIGTTRMATDAREGVVDADCCVHGMGNLFIAGSSVFPTGGWANPTLTILALALRLGDHLKGRSEFQP
ncbi:MAG: GMC family oxidoreductase [Alphaproteobacteria bacterium]|nr:GMC family oxidoreductase [Alphaproteobacteria bacterium]